MTGRSLVQQLERGIGAARVQIPPIRLGDRKPLQLPAVNLGAVTLGAIAVGAVAIGALAIARLAIGRLSIGRARIRDLDIENLTVHHLRVQEEIPFRPDDPGPRKAAPDQDIWEPS